MSSSFLGRVEAHTLLETVKLGDENGVFPAQSNGRLALLNAHLVTAQLLSGLGQNLLCDPLLSVGVSQDTIDRSLQSFIELVANHHIPLVLQLLF